MSFVIDRRRWLAGTAGGVFGFAMRHGCDRLFAADPVASSGGTGPIRRCIVLWMDGGPSQLETFDPKPGAAVGGPTRAIATSVPGLAIAEHLPSIAEHMDRLCVVRNLKSPEGDHDRGNRYLHTGFVPVPAFPRPSLGSLVSHAWGAKSAGSAPEIPAFVSLGGSNGNPAFLGPDHAPLMIDDPAATARLIGELRSRRRRLTLLDDMNRDYAATQVATGLDRRRTTLERIGRILDTSFGQALDVERAPAADRARYGEGGFADRCLTARRLLESGVRFVEVAHGGWDTHGDNFAQVARLAGEIDRPWAALLDDLQASGLWDETLLVWMGEFGRTPQINGDNGRDHFPDVTPVVLGGGGLKRGIVLGASADDGNAIDGATVTVPDLFATLLTALGRDPYETLQTDFGSPAEVTEGGKPIAELLA